MLHISLNKIFLHLLSNLEFRLVPLLTINLSQIAVDVLLGQQLKGFDGLVEGGMRAERLGNKGQQF